MGTKSYGCLLGISLFWWAITGTFAAVTIHGIVRQFDAQRRFLAATGTVISSEVVTSRGGKGGTLYRAKIRYRYTALGREYVSDRTTFETSSSSSGADSSRGIVEAHPPGKEIQIGRAHV